MDQIVQISALRAINIHVHMYLEKNRVIFIIFFGGGYIRIALVYYQMLGKQEKYQLCKQFCNDRINVPRLLCDFLVTVSKITNGIHEYNFQYKL